MKTLRALIFALVFVAGISAGQAYATDPPNAQGWVRHDVQRNGQAGWSWSAQWWNGYDYIQDWGLRVPAWARTAAYVKQNVSGGPLSADGGTPMFQIGTASDTFYLVPADGSMTGTYTIVGYADTDVTGFPPTGTEPWYPVAGQPIAYAARVGATYFDSGGDIAGYWWGPNNGPPAQARWWTEGTGTWTHLDTIKAYTRKNNHARSRLLITWIPQTDGTTYDVWASVARVYDGPWSANVVHTYHEVLQTDGAYTPAQWSLRFAPGLDGAMSLCNTATPAVQAIGTLGADAGTVAAESTSSIAALAARDIVQNARQLNDLGLAVPREIPDDRPAAPTTGTVPPEITTETVNPPDWFPPGASGLANSLVQWLWGWLMRVIEPIRDMLWFLTGG